MLARISTASMALLFKLNKNIYIMKRTCFKGEEGQALTSSLLVAEKFGKEHRTVLASIRELIKGCAENYADPMFILKLHIPMTRTDSNIRCL